MAKKTIQKTAGRVREAAKHAGRKTRKAVVVVGVPLPTGPGSARCERCGRKFSISSYCAQCALEIGKMARVKRQKR